MNKTIKYMAVFATAILPFTSYSSESLEEVKHNVITNIPYIDVVRISNTPLDNIYYLETKNGLYMVDGSGKYVINGDLIDMTKEINLSNKKKGEIAKEEMAKINSSDYIRFEAKNKKHTLYMFSDTSCPFCRKFHKEIPELNEHGIEVVILPYPRGYKRSNSYNDLVQILCSKDRKSALKAVENGDRSKLPPINSCALEQRKVELSYALGNKLGVTGTPTMFFENGVKIGGYTTAKTILAGVKKMDSTK